MSTIFRRIGLIIMISLFTSGSALGVVLLKPNLCPRTCDLERHAHQYFGTDSVLFWFDNSIANIGPGPLYLKSSAEIAEDTALAIQGILWEDEDIEGPIFDPYIYDTIGLLVYHDAPGHEHWHFDGFGKYRLMEIVADTGIGDTLIVSPKIGFCLVDWEEHDSTECGCGPMSGASPGDRVFPTSGCNSAPPDLVMGISVGWADLYAIGVPGQSMNVSGIPNGAYWLESSVNPEGAIAEGSAGNNIQRIKVQVISQRDQYEPNNSKATVDTLSLGGDGSANLAPCGFPVVIEELNIHDSLPNYHEFAHDEDWFRFRVCSTAVGGQYVRIDFDGSLGDLQLELRSSFGDSLSCSAGSGDSELVSLEGRAAGWYYARVYPAVKRSIPGESQYHTCYNYRLEINAPHSICGDMTGDGSLSAADVVALSNYCNYGTPLTCHDSGDVDGDCDVDCTDRNLLQNFVFLGQALPQTACGCY